MANVVLIMDMPPVCGCCKMYRGNYFTGGECTCLITGDKVELNNKADTCPLRELPERETEMTDADDLGKDYVRGTMDGWNACLDEITGGNANEK